MATLNPTPRPSRTEKLVDLYNNVNANPATGIRSHIYNRAGLMSWGLSKDAGAPAYMSTNKFSDTQYTRTFQPSSFAVFAGSPGSFNKFALNYAVNGYRHDNSRYL